MKPKPHPKRQSDPTQLADREKSIGRGEGGGWLNDARNKMQIADARIPPQRGGNESEHSGRYLLGSERNAAEHTLTYPPLCTEKKNFAQTFMCTFYTVFFFGFLFECLFQK